MTDLGATSLKINQDVMENKVEVIFDRPGTRYVFRCDKWGDVGDNLRAIYHAIHFLYKALTEYGVVKDETAFDETFQRIFGGFIATPDDTVLMLTDGNKAWWEILGVEQTATKEAVRNAYRALAKIHHPDAGGNQDDFKRLRRAYEQAMDQLK
jgi:DnaJ-domain-containing protein 1